MEFDEKRKMTSELQRHSRIGITTRGEPALRFIRAVKEFNTLNKTDLQTVVFFEIEDFETPYVKEAHVPFRFPSARGFFQGTIKNPYLNHELLIHSLRASECDAVWAGWGFLAEDAGFVAHLESEGFVFLGPTSKTMSQLGDKVSAKNLAERIGIPVVPWKSGTIESIDEALHVAREIGYPVMLKASLTGGGRGIRRVNSADQLKELFSRVSAETLRISGHTGLFIEKYIDNARHLEVQVLADRCGNVRTYGVRDCSVQRKHQKIIEETPPPRLDIDVIRDMEAAARKLMVEAAYESAGTVEFIYDIDARQFYFMEVNTRLQVEHPITEAVFCIDLVKEQIAIAMGQPLKETPQALGVAIEVRLNAEDPDKEFQPTPGRVLLYQPPSGPGIRVDAGIERNSVIPAAYDSMVAKIISYARTREEALARLLRALRELRIKIESGTTNRAFLMALIQHASFLEGSVSTHFVESLLLSQTNLIERPDWDIVLVVLAIRQYTRHYHEELKNFRQQFHRISPPQTLSRASENEITLSHGGNSYTFTVKSVGNNIFHCEIGENTIAIQYLWQSEESLLLHGQNRYVIQMVERNDLLQCEVNGIPYYLELETHGTIRAPSPAMVVKCAVSAGQQVKEKELLLILEAMKMEMIIVAPTRGVIRKTFVQAGEQIFAGQKLVEMDVLADSDDPAPTSPPVTECIQFDRLFLPPLSTSIEAVEQHWEYLRREFLAPFLGYESGNPEKLPRIMFDFSRERVGFHEKLVRTLIDAIEIYCTVERLFSREQIYQERAANSQDFQELLMHFFWRIDEREKGLPEEFLLLLNEAIKWYPWADLNNNEASTRALFRIYKSHAYIKLKQKVVLKSLNILEVSCPKNSTADFTNRLSALLSELSHLTQKTNPSLSDTALHARFVLIDNPILLKMKEEKALKVRKLLESIASTDKNQTSHRRKLYHNVVESGHHIVFDLMNFGLEDDHLQRKLALELLTRRFNRDRNYICGQLLKEQTLILYQSQSAEKEKRLRMLVTILREDTFVHDVHILATSFLSSKPSDEVIILVQCSLREKEEEFFEELKKLNMNVSWCCLGLFFQSGQFIYRTFHVDETNTWNEDRTRQFLSPLMFRELRVHRLRNFALQPLYHSESVLVCLGRCLINSRDERLFALLEVPEPRVDFAGDGTIRRVVAFENALREVFQAIQAEQSRRKRRLFWNRIIIHIRAPLTVSREQLKQYVTVLAPRMSTLGLEKLVLYTRSRKQGKMEETEFLFENISGPLFTLRKRLPSDIPLLPMDEYVARVIKARQRGTVYPYQIIKMITRGDESNEEFPHGSFQEYDISVDPVNGLQTTFPVPQERFAQEESNIVFGLIENSSESFDGKLQRVAVFNDPTIDMAALGEPECRRIIAAIDLAEEKNLPVEWITVSSGARIDMHSGTENLDWTARVLRRIIIFTQKGGEINIIVAGINVGAQSYWNAEATMLMHTKGILIMTEQGTMQLTGKKALDFSGSISAEDNLGIGGIEKIMGPNGEAQLGAHDLPEAYRLLFTHYYYTYCPPGSHFPPRKKTTDPFNRNICIHEYKDVLEQGFSRIGDIFDKTKNPERKKPFAMRALMNSIRDQDDGFFERWEAMRDAETAIAWETRIGGISIGLIGIESRNLTRFGAIPNDGPDSWSGGTLFPLSSKKVSRAINSWSKKVPVVVLANLSGFDGSPESLRNCQLEAGAEIGRAIVNFQGPILFIVVARYHGGAYVVFSQALNENLHAIALENTYASVIGGAPAAAVVFQQDVLKETWSDPRVIEAQDRLDHDSLFKRNEFEAIFSSVFTEKQSALATKFDSIHSVQRAQKVGSISSIIGPEQLRPFIISTLEKQISKTV